MHQIRVKIGDPYTRSIFSMIQSNLNIKDQIRGCLTDTARNFLQEASHRFDVFLFHMGDDLQFLRSISCHDSGSCGGFDSTQSTSMWNNHAFYIFYNISADRNLHPLRKGSQCLSGNSSRISDGDRLGTSHRRHQFIFQDLDISSVIFF